MACAAQVRWHGLVVLMVTLGDAVVSLLTTVNRLLPVLPGSPLQRKSAPVDIQLTDWPSVHAVWTILHGSIQNEPSAAAEAESASTPHRRRDPLDDL